MDDPQIQQAYLDYRSRYPHVNAYYRATLQYKNQISRVNGRKQGTDINLYKLFTEQCYNLLRDGGTCGIVIPSGIYSDLGAKQLRQMLFGKTRIDGLFGFENRKAVFEGVHRSFKFIVLTFEKGGQTNTFPATFMRHDIAELERFPDEESVMIDVDLVRRSSPYSLSIAEFKNVIDMQIIEKMLWFPLLSEDLPDAWNIKLKREFHMTDDSDLFHTESGAGRLPLYEGKMIWQFEHSYSAPRYWIDEQAERERVLGKRSVDHGQTLGYEQYRFAYRKVASSTNERTVISTVLPPSVFAGESFTLSESLSGKQSLVCVSLLNSYIADWAMRQRVDANVTMFYMQQLPIPRLKRDDRFFSPIVQRAAKLICTAPEYDDLAAEIGLGGHHNGVSDPAERAKLRAELDGMIAHIYGLTEDEFAYVLSTFPLVGESVKAAALAAYREL